MISSPYFGSGVEMTASTANLNDPRKRAQDTSARQQQGSRPDAKRARTQIPSSSETIRKDSEEAQSVTKVTIATNYDAFIKLKAETGDDFHYAVDTHILCAASPVFNKWFGEGSAFIVAKEKARLNPSFKPAIRMYEKPGIMGTVLNILHLKNNTVSRRMNFFEMVQLTIMAEKYGLQEACKTWAELWARDFQPIDLKKPGSEEWLFVAHVFQLEEYGTIFRAVASRTCISADGSLMIGGFESGAKRPFHPRMPATLIEKLKTLREASVKRIHALVENVKFKYIGAAESSCLLSYSDDCNPLQLGDYLLQIEHLGLNKDEFWDDTLDEIVSKLRASLIPRRLPVKLADSDHTHCSWVWEVLEKVEAIVKAFSESLNVAGGNMG